MKNKLTLFIQFLFMGLLFFSVIDVGYSQNSISLTGAASVWGDCGSTDAGTAGITIVSFEIASSSLLPPTGGPPFVITAPTGYELKQTASSTYSDFIQLTVVGGTITGLPLGIDIRLKSTNTAGTAPAGYITFNYAGDIIINHRVYVWGAINPGTPEIDVLGNSNQIANGLTTLSTVNGTDFGSVAVDLGNQINEFEIFNLGSGDLTLSGDPKVSLTNTTDFAIYIAPLSPVDASKNTSVRIIFDPVTSGAKTCTVSIANDDGDENPYTFDIGGEGIGVPVDVVAAKASGITTTGFTAVWNPVAGATSYLLDVSDDNFATYYTVYEDYSVDGTFSIISSLTTGINYYYRVRAVNVAGNSANESNIITVPTMETVNATAASAVHTADFVANWDLASGASSYSIEWDDNIDFSSPTIAAEASNSYLVNSDLSAGKTFYYHVRGVNSTPEPDAVVEWSDIITVTTLPNEPTIGFSDGTIATNSFDPTWTAPVGQIITEFRIDVATDNFFATKVVDNMVHTSGSTKSGLLPSTTYYWRVRSVNGSGISANSVTQSFTTLSDGNAEISLLGNGSSISDDDTYSNTPAEINNTDFGDLAVASGKLNQFEILNSGTSSLQLTGGSLISLSNTTDFTVNVSPTTPIAATESTTFRILFFPASVGIKTCEVTIANDDTDENPYNFMIQGTGVDVPDDVTALTATGVSSVGFTAVWNIVAGNDISYKLDVSTASDFSSYVSGYENKSLTATSLAISGSSGTTYYYRVRASNVAGDSNNESNVIAVTTIETVTATSASSISSTAFTANWNAAGGAATYSIQWDDNNVFSSPSSANTSDIYYTVSTGLSSGSTYYYRVRGVSGVTYGDWSNIITILTVPTSPSSGFGNGAIAANSFDPTWDAPVGQIISEYKIDVAIDNLFASKVVDNETQISGVTKSGLSPSTEYYWRVRSVNSSGTSTNSTVQSFITLSDGNSEISVLGSGSSIPDDNTYSNTPVVGNNTDFGDFAVSSGKLNEFEILNTGTSNLKLTGTPIVYLSNTIDFTVGVMPGTPILASGNAIFRISFHPQSTGIKTCQVNIDNDDTNENPYNFLIQGTGVGAPDDVVAVSASGVSSVGFTAVWNPVAGADSYILDVSTVADFSSYFNVYENYSVSGSSYVISGEAGISYYYRVKAVNVAGNSTNESNVITATTIETVTATSPTSVGTSAFTANWNVAAGADTYSIQWDDNISFTLPSSDNLSLTSYLVNTGLSAGNTFYYRVKGVKGAASGDWSNTMSVLTVPDAPSILDNGTVTSSSFASTWTAPTGQTINSYRIDVATDNLFLSKVVDDQLHTSAAAISSLSANTTYYWRVRSVNSAGTSINSATQTAITTGATSSSWKSNATTVIWDNVDNWSDGIPTAATDAIILAGSNQPEISGTATCSNLTINEGANVKIIASGSLTVSNTLTLESSSASTDAGTIIDLGSLSYTTLNAKRYITPNLAHLLSSPVASNTLTGAITDVTSGNGFAHQYNPGDGAWDGLTAPGTLAVMKGYRVKFTDAAHTASFSGTLNTGNKTIAISRSANNFGWNLVGNPYPSVIDWDLVSKPANMNGTLAKWNDATSNYVYYNEGGSASRFVSPMNGFFVQVTLGQLSETFQLDNEVRTKSSGTFYKRGSTQKWLNISVRGENGYSDKAFIRVLNNSTINGEGTYNAYKLFSPVDEVPQLYSTDFGSDPMAINSISEIKDNLVVPFGLRIGEAGKYTISIDGINDFEEKNIYLEDVVENKMIPIKIEGSELPANLYYSFTSEVSQINERFKVHFSNVITDVEDIEASVPHIYSQQNNIYINTTNVMNDVTIRVFDVVGKQVGLMNANELNGLSKYKMDVPDGIYIIKVNSTKGVNTQKVYLTK